MAILDTIALILVIVGGLNWGSIGLFDYNFVTALLGGPESMIADIVFIAVGIAALWCITLLFKDKMYRKDR